MTCATSCAPIDCSPQLGVTGEAYNVASGHDVALSDIATQLVERIAPDVKLVIDPALLRPIDVPVFRGSYDKLAPRDGLVAADPARPVA